MLSELLILAICITLFTCDPKNGVACHGVRYSSMVKHRDSESDGVGLDSSWQLRFYFFDPHSWQHEHKTSLLKTLPFKKNLRHHWVNQFRPWTNLQFWSCDFRPPKKLKMSKSQLKSQFLWCELFPFFAFYSVFVFTPALSQHTQRNTRFYVDWRFCVTYGTSVQF